jgi:hypothetical protein
MFQREPEHVLKGSGMLRTVVPSALARDVVAKMVVLLPLLASACGVARSNQIAAMNSAELATVSDRDICQGLMFNRSNTNLLAEGAKRQLGDCSSDHFTCVSWGASFGSQPYLQCRTQLAAAARTALAIRLAVPPPQRQPQCVSVATGTNSSTTCY